jgi:hypothetical protein
MPVGASLIPDRALAAIRKLAEAHSFRATMTTTQQATTRTAIGPIRTNLEIVLPNSFRVSGEEYQAIIIGPDSYLKLPGRAWEKTVSPPEVTNLTDPKKLEDYLSTALEIKTVDPPAAGSAADHVYQARLKYPPTSKAHLLVQPFNVKLWIGRTDGRLRKIEGVAAHSQSRTTVVFYDYDARLEIAPPFR